MAALPAAVLGDLDQAGGQHGLGGGHLAQAGVQHAADERRVLGDVHVFSVSGVTSPRPGRLRSSIEAYPEKASKGQVRRKKKQPWATRRRKEQTSRRLGARQGAKNRPLLTPVTALGVPRFPFAALLRPAGRAWRKSHRAGRAGNMVVVGRS